MSTESLTDDEFIQQLCEKYGEAKTAEFTLIVQTLSSVLIGLWLPPVQYPGLHKLMAERFLLTRDRLHEISDYRKPQEVVRFMTFCSRQMYVMLVLADLLFDSPAATGWRKEVFGNKPNREHLLQLANRVRSRARSLMSAWEKYEPKPDEPADPELADAPADEQVAAAPDAAPEPETDAAPDEPADDAPLDPNEDEGVPSGQELRELRRELETLISQELVTGATWQPDRRGPFLRRNFSELELAALRLLLTYVPDLGPLLPDYPLALAMQSLSGLQPAPRLADIRQRLQDLKPQQPIHLSIHDTISLLQTIHAGALLLLPSTLERLTRLLRRQLDRGPDLDETTREQCSRLLLLLTDADTYTRFRKVFGPLTQSFAKAVDQTFPHNPDITAARTEIAELAALR